MQVVIHAGVAFTDERQLTDLHLANRTTLNAQNTSFLAFRAYKRHFRAALQALEPGAQTDAIREDFLKRLPQDGSAQRVILSTRHYIGEDNTLIMDGQFYPLAGQRIAYLSDVFEGMRLSLYLALRNPGSFIPRVLMNQPEAERLRILEDTDLSCLSWLTLIDNIRDLAPDVEITLWSNEDIPLICGDIARSMAGLSEDTPLEGEYSLLSSLVSDAGKHEIQALTHHNPRTGDPALRTELSRIFKDYALPEAIEEEVDLPGWSDDIVAAFTELYEQDIEMLQNMPDVRFLRP